jgi:hypothetical protein
MELEQNRREPKDGYPEPAGREPDRALQNLRPDGVAMLGNEGGGAIDVGLEGKYLSANCLRLDLRSEDARVKLRNCCEITLEMRLCLERPLDGIAVAVSGPRLLPLRRDWRAPSPTRARDRTHLRNGAKEIPVIDLLVDSANAPVPDESVEPEKLEGLIVLGASTDGIKGLERIAREFFRATIFYRAVGQETVDPPEACVVEKALYEVWCEAARGPEGSGPRGVDSFAASASGFADSSQKRSPG